jgi:molybdopterin-guanine dinucleotide biosynthesis protein A
MGCDKATIEIDGQPLWDRQLAILRELKPEAIFVSVRTTPAWLPPKTELLLDDPPSHGPLSGLTKALIAMRTTHLLALAVDMPFMTGEQLGRLCEMAAEDRGVVPVIRDRAEPLAAVYPAQATRDFAAALAGLDFSLQGIIRKLAAAKKVSLVPVPTDDEYRYRSVNEPADLEEGGFPNRPLGNVGGL